MVSVTDTDEPKVEGKDDNKTVPSSVNFDLEKNKIDEAIIAERIQTFQQIEDEDSSGTVECDLTFQIVFRDTGCGISEENQKILFHNFAKLEESKEKNKAGVGLGLSICREIILSQGGSIDIKSEVGKGTDFIVNMKAKCLVDKKRIREAKNRMESLGYYATSEYTESSNNGSEEDPCTSSKNSSFSGFGKEDRKVSSNLFGSLVSLQDKNSMKLHMDYQPHPESDLSRQLSTI